VDVTDQRIESWHGVEIVFALFLTLTVAQADEPTKAADGSICMRVLIPASETDIRQELDTAQEASGLFGSAKLVSVEPDGDCERLSYRTPGLFTSMTYIARRCPTADGWVETLVSGDSFEDNTSSMRLRSVDGGTEVDFRIRVRLRNIPVGQGIIDAQIAQSIKRAVERLEERVSGN
jgi:hypothetical protein